MPNTVIRQRVIIDNIDSVTRMKNNQQLLSFCSNNTLGLANHPQVIAAAKHALEKYGMGSKSSALLSGYSRLHAAFEEEIATFMQQEAALVFPSGYMANVGFFSTFKPRQVSMDKRCHASIYDGLKMSQAQVKRYHHPDQLSDAGGLIVTEGVFSMDGQFAALSSLLTKNTPLYVDDAHGFGWAGDHGRGTFEALQLTPHSTTTIMATLSKSLGCHGAFIAGSKNTIETLIQHCRSYIYTTALPPHLMAAALAALHIIQNEPQRREKLRENIAYFQHCAQQLNLPVRQSQTPIQIVMIGDHPRTMVAHQQLERQGILTQAIRAPTVPAGRCRIRISLNADHTRQHIEQLLGGIVDVI